MKVLLALLLAAAIQSSTATALYDERGRMTSVSNLLRPEDKDGCNRVVRVGPVTRADYDNQGRLIDFTIKARQGSLKFYLTESHIGAEDSRRLPTLIKRGRRVRVVAYGCGATAAVLDADSVEGL